MIDAILPASDGRMAENILHFARLLRSAGLPIGSGKVLDAISAVETLGIGLRDDFYWCMFALFVHRQDQRELFDQAFHLFWRNPHMMDRMMNAMLPTIKVDREEELNEMSRRLSEAMGASQPQTEDNNLNEEVEFDSSFTFSSKEVLQDKDFESMSAEEIEEAKLAIAKLRLPIVNVPTRRFKPDNHSARVDMRATLRASLRSGNSVNLKFRIPKLRHPPLVILCDISGSMSQYSRLFLHFMHAITNDQDRVHAFVFGTRLTSISRHLRHKDIDVALDKVSDSVNDWSGGTQIGSCLKEFNSAWSRRVLGQGAMTLIISDGLDRGETTDLSWQMERLSKSSRKLIWLNPLLRYDEFEPKAQGIRAMLPHVDEFRSCHSLNSLLELSDLLSQPADLRNSKYRRAS